MPYLTILLALFCVACGSYSANVPTIKPYKMDIQQGNVVTSKMMLQLRPGMTKSQVRFIMGTPLLVDSFHADRWDYFYQMRKDGKIIEQRRVILVFEGDALAHVRGDVIPAGTDPSSAPATSAAKPQGEQSRPVVKPAPKAKEKGLLDKLKFWGDDEKDAPKPQPKPEAPPKTEAKPEPKPESEVEQPASVEAPLPPLMDEAMQTEPESSITVPQEKPIEPITPKPKAPIAAPQEKPSQAVVPKEKTTEPAVPKEEKKGWLDKLKFWGDDEKDTPKPKEVSPAAKPAEPAPSPKVVAPKPQVPAPVEKAPAPKAQPRPEVKPKAPPQPPELPPEEDPGYFEKMLEKIGF